MIMIRSIFTLSTQKADLEMGENEELFQFYGKISVFDCVTFPQSSTAPVYHRTAPDTLEL